MDNAAFDSMSNELQSNVDLETQIGKVSAKLFSKNDNSVENSGLWPDKKVYYAFSPNVGKQRLLFYMGFLFSLFICKLQ